MKKNYIWSYGIFTAGIILVVAGIAFVESKKSNSGELSRQKTSPPSAYDIKAKTPLLSGMATENANEKEVNDVIAKYSKTDDSDEKVSILYKLSLVSNSKMLELVYKALEDPSDDVRLAAAQLLDNLDANTIIPAISKALDDKNEEVRLLAIHALMNADIPETAKLLAKGIRDDSEDVRNAVFSVVSDKDTPTKEAILGEVISSRFQDVREKIVDLAVETPSHKTVEILLGALKNGNAEMKKDIFTIMTVFFSEEFKTSDEARNWWAKNKGRFDDELVEK